MRPAIWMATALTAGILLAEWWRPHLLVVLLISLAVLLSSLLARGRWTGLALLLAVAALGTFRYSYDQTLGRGTVLAWMGQKVAVAGTVVTEPQLRSSRSHGYVLSVSEAGGNGASGLLHVTQWTGEPPVYGERISLTGRLKAPLGPRIPGGFDEAEYLGRQGVYVTVSASGVERHGPGSLGWLRRSAVAARLRLEGVLKEALPGDQAALAAGLLFGSRADLPEEIRLAFRTTGVFHLLAVSGGNVAMILIFPTWLLRRMGLQRRWVAAAMIPLVIFFVFLTGAGPSVARAGLMATLVLLGDLLRRERDVVNTMGAAAFILLLIRPALLFDLGFQLSVSATLGILLFSRPVKQWLRPRLERWLGSRIGHPVADGLSATMAAQLLVEPISLHNFGAFSAIAPVANLVVLVFVERVVQLGMLASLLGLASLPVAVILLWPVRIGLWALVAVVKLIAAIPFAYLEVGRLPLAWVLLWYGLVAVAVVPRWRRALADRAGAVAQWWRGGGRQARIAVIGVAAMVSTIGFTWRLALAAPPDLLEVHFLDVGQGDSILVQAPGGESMLIDAGPYLPGDLARGLSPYDSGAEVILPFLADRGVARLDYLVLTHADQDHAGGGLSIIAGLPVGSVLLGQDEATEVRYNAALSLAREEGLPLRRPRSGERFRLGTSVLVEVLNPPATSWQGTRSDDNANCLALRLTYRQVSILFACDIEAEVEEGLVSGGSGLRADLLKVAHHGSRFSSTERFLDAVRPRWAVISAGNGNRFGHPHNESLARLERVGARILRTDRQGTISARTDGFQLSVRASRRDGPGSRCSPARLMDCPWWGAW